MKAAIDVSGSFNGDIAAGLGRMLMSKPRGFDRSSVEERHSPESAQSRNGVRISAVIKAKNEERNIIDCMRSLGALPDEIIVVDDHSDDSTRSLALANGARVIDAQSRDGYIDVLDKIGFEAARGQWLLRIDADERMTPTLAAALSRIVDEGEYAGVRFARRNVMFGAVAWGGGWFRADQLRLFRADAWDRGWSAAPHTQTGVFGKVLTLPAREELSTLHLDYDSVEQFVRRTLLGYASVEALTERRGGRRFSVARLLLRPPKVFLGRLIFRAGWRDGVRGVILAGLLACYAFLIEAMLWDLQRLDG